ncbi:hypothetical protein SAMN05880590_1318 [Rhizobium sp. RU35A]|uniref:hypothetical protein n=1 Tax=Rhizobium sp. RU35A TaxID=1907414 RepID=UPI000955AA39|nr:hypothetical protein [Rhizobium sp. RU35A]SIR42808.1 hypothetical protein SAMN05880590_1318 [Rhizobium sp. RU35A]
MARNSATPPSTETETGGSAASAPETIAVEQDDETVLLTILRPVRINGVKFMPDSTAPVPHDLIQSLDARGIIDMRERD